MGECPDLDLNKRKPKHSCAQIGILWVLFFHLLDLVYFSPIKIQKLSHICIFFGRFLIEYAVGLFKYTFFWKTYAPKVLYGEVACSEHYVIFFSDFLNDFLNPPTDPHVQDPETMKSVKKGVI